MLCIDLVRLGTDSTVAVLLLLLLYCRDCNSTAELAEVRIDGRIWH